MQVNCTQCGGQVPLVEGSLFATCPYCTSALYVDKSKTVFHFVVSPTIQSEEAAGKLRRWMAGNETVKDLDTRSTVTSQDLVYFPMWRFVGDDTSGNREFSEMASSFAISEIKSIPLSGGDLKFFSPTEFGNLPMREPEILLDSALQWLKNDHNLDRNHVKEINLIHVPFYLFKYDYKNTTYQSVVDGVSGRVLASIYPAKSEIPFTGLTILFGVLFLLAGMIADDVFTRLLYFAVLGAPFLLLTFGVVKKF